MGRGLDQVPSWYTCTRISTHAHKHAYTQDDDEDDDEEEEVAMDATSEEVPASSYMEDDGFD